MLPKIRVMPTLLFKDVGLVKGIGFDSWRRVGSALQAVKVYNMREVDELVFLDIHATREARPPDFETVDELADECFMPLTVGGGVRCVEDVRRLLQVGADKVVVNSAAVARPELVSEIANRFGSQCVVVAIDFRLSGGTAEVYTDGGTRAIGKSPVSWACEAEKLGAGEILLTSIDRDGTMLGYDVDLTRQVTAAVGIPVIAAGGAGSYEHMRRVIADAEVPAVAAASMFHFTEQTPLEAKRYLRDCGMRVRS
jgi:cyclase